MPRKKVLKSGMKVLRNKGNIRMAEEVLKVAKKRRGV
jgi:hypothetical protein